MNGDRRHNGQHGATVPLPATAGISGVCPVCDGNPRVLVAIRHPAMRRFTRELLERDHGCWVATAAGLEEPLEVALARTRPDLLIVDAADFPGCCRAALERFPSDRVVVVGPEPDLSYRHAALAAGAGGWLPRERVDQELGLAMRAALGCHHDPCPSGDHYAAPSGHGHTTTTSRIPAGQRSGGTRAAS